MGARDMAHEYLISPIEISVKWPGSKQLWTRPIYTDFNGANYVFMRPYLEPPWTNSCQIWCVRVFHHVLLKYGNEMKKIKFDDIILQYSILSLQEIMFVYDMLILLFYFRPELQPVEKEPDVILK